ncbi:hypothetical protein B9Q11_02395 [Candidatus Marsarchaeota G2 archaeon ECH_B_SAG-F08]|uniref:Tryptophan synthase beta chain-like PALP domain-containing protein n=1 Tax=Candidatus Marsarchaeota G2 archaeon ECH_B_SAG-F08 TaxID=1978165 RepID=A0A2R6BIA3_9ARCH|nr:MAG: hypothetical protein B9Q11_02395 [Candidatus Marsarchaeota G2 archaeon ECH_B_SAG-F08]
MLTFGKILQAKKRIKHAVTKTPLIESPALSKIFSVKVYLKLECYQPIRVFKLRGAYNKISLLESEHIFAASSGNHGLAVAYSCRQLGKKCTVVVPQNIIQEKLEAIEEMGATVVRYGKYHHEREAEAKRLAQEMNGAFVHPFDDEEVVAGQGTIGLEIFEDLPEADCVVVPVGGGGLIAGVATALKTLNPSIKIYGVEPQGAPKLKEALKAGKPVQLSSTSSIADGLISTTIGKIGFEVAQKFVDEVYSVSDQMILDALKILVTKAHVIAEPSAATTLALLSQKKVGEKVVLIISGANISLKLLQQILQG